MSFEVTEGDSDFQGTGKRVCVKIDDQPFECIEIEEIIRLPTNIIMAKQVSATLYNSIEIDMLIVVPDETEEMTDAYIKEVPKGFVNISITNINKNITYEEKKISFRDGIIQTTMTDKLGIGDYLLTVEYAGNRYYEPTTLLLQFTVEKRMVECQFHTNVSGGYPNEKIEVPITLFDSLNGKTINNCAVHYSFNNNDYITYTNNHGYANLSFNMPDVNGDYCATSIITNDEEVIDEHLDDDADLYWTIDGTLVPYEDDDTQFGYDDPIQNDFIDADNNTEEDDIPDPIVDDIPIDYDDEEEDEEIVTQYNVYVYDLTITIDNNVYQMDEQVVYLAVNKFDTQITAHYTKDDSLQMIFVEGDVLNYNEYMISNVTYGIVELYISDINYNKKVYIDEYGHFTFNIPYSDLTESPSNNIERFIYFCSPDHPTRTVINDVETTEFYRNYETHNSVNFIATVTDQFTNKRINESMVTFIIHQEDREVYRYVTEVNENGEANISFDISLIGDFTIQAFYHPMFNLLGSESQIVEYTVKDISEEE